MRSRKNLPPQNSAEVAFPSFDAVEVEVFFLQQRVFYNSPSDMGSQL